MISEFINASRITKEVVPSISDMYTEQFNHLCKLFSATHKEFVPPKLFVTNSLNRRCELVNLMNKQYVVFDENIDVSLFRLTKILNLSKTKKCSENLALSYGYKVIYQELLVSGELELAFLLGLASVKIKGDEQSNGSPFYQRETESMFEAESNRIEGKFVQNYFIIGHELAHYSEELERQAKELNSNTQFSEVFEEFCEGYLNTEATNTSLVEMSQKYGQSYADEYKKNYKNIEKYKKSLISNHSKLLHKECYADYWATLFALTQLCEVGNYKPSVVRESILITFKFLRFFEYLRKIKDVLIDISKVKGQNKFKEALSSSLSFENLKLLGGDMIQVTQFREAFLRQNINFIIERYNLGNVDDGLDELKDKVDLFDEVFERTAISVIPELLRNGLSYGSLYSLKKKKMCKEELIDNTLKFTSWCH